LEDYIFDVVQDEYSVSMPIDEVDRIISMIWDLAVKNRDAS